MAEQVKVKICGITSEEDYALVTEAGADLAGFVFVPGTLRAVSAETVRGILDLFRGKMANVGLFVNADIESVVGTVSACGLDHVQLHGDESPGYVEALRGSLAAGVGILKTFRVSDRIHLPDGAEPADYRDADMLVFDAYHPQHRGGTGARYDVDVLVRAREEMVRPFFVAGGLDAGNVGEVVRRIRPYGVDVSSGTESVPGNKDERKVKEFVKNAKSA